MKKKTTIAHMNNDELTTLANHYDEYDPMVADIMSTEDTEENEGSTFVIPGEDFSACEISAAMEGDYDWLLSRKKEKFTQPENILKMMKYAKENGKDFNLVSFIKTFSEYFDDALISAVVPDVYSVIGNNIEAVKSTILVRGLQFISVISEIPVILMAKAIENHYAAFVKAIMARFGIKVFKAYIEKNKASIEKEFIVYGYRCNSNVSFLRETYSNNDLFNDTWAWLETTMLEMQYKDVFNKLLHCNFNHFIKENFNRRRHTTMDAVTEGWLDRFEENCSNSYTVDRILAADATNVRKLYLLSELNWEKINFDEYKFALERLITQVDTIKSISEITAEMKPYRSGKEDLRECMEHLMFIILCKLPEDYWNKKEFYECVVTWFDSKELPFNKFLYPAKGLAKNPEFVVKHKAFFDNYLYILADYVDWTEDIFMYMVDKYPMEMKDLTYIMNEEEGIYLFIMEVYPKHPIKFMQSVKELSLDVYYNLDLFTCYEDNYIDDDFNYNTEDNNS